MRKSIKRNVGKRKNTKNNESSNEGETLEMSPLDLIEITHDSEGRIKVEALEKESSEGKIINGEIHGEHKGIEKEYENAEHNNKKLGREYDKEQSKGGKYWKT